MVMNTENYMVIINDYNKNDYDKIEILKFDGKHYANAIKFTDNHENVYENLQDMNEDEADIYIDGLYTAFCELAKIIGLM